MKYEMLEQGCHVEGNRKLREGDVIDTDTPLSKLFPNRFRIVGSSDSPTQPITIPATGTLREEPEPLGEDVTGLFPFAARKDLKVYKVGNLYRVVDADSINQPLDQGNLTSQKKVATFIDEYGS